jgi:hypothetical protein
MKHLFLTLLLATLFAATSYGQTLKALAYNTTNGVVAYSGTNTMTFTNAAQWNATVSAVDLGADNLTVEGAIYFTEVLTNIAVTRSNLGLGWSALTNTSATNFLAAVGVPQALLGGFSNSATGTQAVAVGGAFNTASGANAITVGGGVNTASGSSSFAAGEYANAIHDGSFVWNDRAVITSQFFSAGPNTFNIRSQGGAFFDFGTNGIAFVGTNASQSATASRANLGLGATNTPAFRGLTSDGNIVITNQTATNNGLLFIYRTNNEPFLGLANLLASNNTTISNETLFRVGVAEATNQSAQFGFRSTNTNGSGVAVFSVFGYNALMMVGADASTNAVIFSGGGTNNEVMTLIRDGATEFARPIRFSTNASTRPATNAPANTTNVAAWVEFRIGTNSYRAALYQ